MQRVEQFEVGVAIEGAHGGGQLYIAPDAMVARLGPLGRRCSEVEAIEASTATVETRSGWVFVRFDLHGNERTATISVPRWKWPKVREALQRNGVTVTEPRA